VVTCPIGIGRTLINVMLLPIGARDREEGSHAKSISILLVVVSKVPTTNC